MIFNLKTIAAIFIAVTAGYAPVSASYDEALKLFQEKKYKESLQKIAGELNTTDDFNEGSPNFNLRFLAAHNHWKLGNKDSAYSHFKRCMEIKKESVDPYVDSALLMIELKKYGDAERIARKGQGISDSPMFSYILGKISLINKNYPRAKELFEKANSMNQELYISYNDLGIALLNLKKFSQANTAFSIANELHGDSHEILNNLGLSYEKIGDYKKALECFTRAGELDGQNTVIAKNISRVKNRKQ